MTNNTTNNDVPKTNYNSNNFRITQNDATVIFDEVAEQLRLVNFLRNQKELAKYQGNAKKLLDEYVGRVELAIKDPKKAMQDLLTNNAQDAESNRAAKNLYLYTKDKTDEQTATEDAEKLVKDRVSFKLISHPYTSTYRLSSYLAHFPGWVCFFRTILFFVWWTFVGRTNYCYI